MPQLRQSEQAWCLAVNRWGNQQKVRTYFRIVSQLGDGVFWYILMAGMALFGDWHGLSAACHMLATGAIALLLYRKLKRWTRRPRPYAADLRIQAWIAPLDEFSFPSGHTLQAVSFTMVALAYYPHFGWILVPFTLSVAISRIVLGMHYPSDVIAAAIIGSSLAALMLWLVSRTDLVTFRPLCCTL